MAGKGKLAAGLLAALLLGGVIGAGWGARKGFYAASVDYVNLALGRDAREIENRVAILRQLRGGEREKALEGLENGLNDTLIMFDPAEPYPGLRPETTAAVAKAIGAAKEYKTAHPRNPDDMREKMVQSLFSRDLYK